VFAPDVIDEQQGLRLIDEQGAWKSNGFQSLLEIPQPPPQIEPVVAPRPGHMALVLAAGVADGAVIQTEQYGTVAIRGKTQHVEQIARVDVESDPNNPERQIKKTTIRLKPSTTLTLLADDGTLVEMDGDDALLEFITRNKRALAGYLNNKFSPAYQFNMNGLSRWLDRIRLKGRYPLYAAQKHVIAALTKGFEQRDSILLCGMMGTGKTAMAIASGAVKKLADDMRPDQVILIVCPPHLVEKWKRELLSIHPNSVVERIDRHEDVKRFMSRAEKTGVGVPKIGLIKRDLTKLGCGRELAVVWRDEPVALWRRNHPTPYGYEDRPRVVKERRAKCPTCGCAVMQDKKGVSMPASESWLKSGKRTCSVCQTPLWQEARDTGSRPATGEKYPKKNPRYRLDAYIKRVYPDRVYLLIWDEIHEAAHGDTGNGEAFGRLAGVSKKVLAMTGTPFNGKSSSLFNIEYHLNERVRQRYNWGGAERLTRKGRGTSCFQTVIEGGSKQRGRAESLWVSDMGVREQVVEERPTYDSHTGAYTGTSTYERPYEEAPGISPLLVAEVLDHAIFFSLGDLGKALPHYEEIAVPVEMDSDTYDQYDRTRALLKDYLIQRRWEGDTTFRGAYLQWAMGWVNTPFRPTEVIHNIRHPVTGEKRPHIVTQIPSYGEDRIYAKEQALIDLVRDELAAGRPCVVYLRQTATKDIQPRIKRLIRQHVPGAVPYILKNTVQAERREKVIEGQIAAGVNVVICNPELVKTGLDLIHFPTLIFHEITFNLGTMMQAAARAYRLNQTHGHCKTYYIFAEGTMEHTAVQLMSRKQRAAKLLTGDIGLTGLDALTEGELGFEEALLDAIAKDETLLDPSEMFKVSAGQGEIDAEDAAYWNVEIAAEEVDETVLHHDPLVLAGLELGGVLVEEEAPIAKPVIGQDTSRLVRYVGRYLDSVHLIHDEAKRAKLQAKLLAALMDGVQDDNGAYSIVGLRDPDFMTYPVHAEMLIRYVRGWLKQNRVVFMGCEGEAAAKIVDLAQQALGLKPIQLEAFQPVQDAQDEPMRERHPKRRRKLDLLAVPDDTPEATAPQRPLASKRPQDEAEPVQLAMF
jgi:superfamily II DNA or RNA helicase